MGPISINPFPSDRRTQTQGRGFPCPINRRPRAPEARRPASPFRLNLEQQRKRAKELLQGLRAGEADALGRFRRHHPRLANASDPALPDGIARLSEAQLVIARELGLPSWPRLKAHVEAMDRSWARIRRGEVAPDRGMATLHVRCGCDIGPGLKQAGFVGDFLEYSDPFCQGPVLAEPGWLDQRADFLAQAHGSGSGMNRDGIEVKLRQAEEELRSAPSRYERVVLWFEHDSYDQLILARCLARFAERAPSRLELISPGHYPGGMRFIGLGQLPPEALRLLWVERLRFPPRRCASGKKCGTRCARRIRAASPPWPRRARLASLSSAGRCDDTARSCPGPEMD